MTLSAKKHPVELLRDGKGIYGIGVAKDAEVNDRPNDLIFRHDRLQESNPYQPAVLQMITGGFRHGMFTNMSEEKLRQVIHHGMLGRAGLAFHHSGRYWSSDPRQQSRNRQIYHGLRLGSLSVVNRLISQALEEGANQEAVKVARRFRFHYRYNIYRATARSPRVLQIAVAFPALAFAMIEACFELEPFNLYDPVVFKKQYDEKERIRLEALALVEAGASLKRIADLMHIPMAFQKIKPGAVGQTLSYIVHGAWNKMLIHAYMPDSLPRMRRWLSVVELSLHLGPDFVDWVAQHALEIPGSTDQVVNSLHDIKDWVRACHQARIPKHIRDTSANGTDYPKSRGGEFVVRPFSPDMSLKTATKLSNDWHEAVANNMSGPLYEFPEPWCGAGESCGHEIVPITTSADLYREGHALHHCVGAQGDRVQAGQSYFYSIRKDKERIATLELLRDDAGAAIGQLRGPCNSQVSKKLVRAVRSWLRSQREFYFPKERKVADDDISF